jgi:hypothetical protein
MEFTITIVRNEDFHFSEYSHVMPSHFECEPVTLRGSASMPCEAK